MGSVRLRYSVTTEMVTAPGNTEIQKPCPHYVTFLIFLKLYNNLHAFVNHHNDCDMAVISVTFLMIQFLL